MAASNSTKPWSHHDLSILKNHLLAGDTSRYTEIADKLKRSKASVKNKLRQLKRGIAEEEAVVPTTRNSQEGGADAFSRPPLAVPTDGGWDRSIYIWHGILDTVPLGEGGGTAMAIATDIEKAKILVVQELENTGLWAGNVDHLVEQLDKKRCVIYGLSDFAIYL